MLVLDYKFCLGRLLRSNYVFYYIRPPLDKDARGGDLNARP